MATMAIDWQSLLRRYMAHNFVPEEGDECAGKFTADELAALRAIEQELAAADDNIDCDFEKLFADLDAKKE